MAATDPNAEWIGNVQPVGLVLAATVLARHGLNPAEQTRADSEAVRALLSDIGGEEINNDPEHKHHRYVIDFADFPLRREKTEASWASMTEDGQAACLRAGIVPLDYPYPVAFDWPDLLEIIERNVKPQRLKQKDKIGRHVWWRFLRRRDRLYETISKHEKVLVAPRVSPTPNFVLIRNGLVFNEKTVVFSFDTAVAFACLQSRVHECWIRAFTSTLKDDLNYAPSDCFANFPFPENLETDAALQTTGATYHAFRAQLMVDRKEGLTKTYNRFHARGENAADIARLRVLHAEIDRTVLRAYGWGDLAERATSQFIEQEADEGKKPKTRLDWRAEFKDEVLAKLLALNAERVAAERAAGITSVPEDEDDEIDEGVDA
jgi:hypothetical protein